MLKIESKDFYPLKGDKDFKVKLKAPSFSEYQDVQIEANKAVPSGGPDTKHNPERLKIEIQKLFEVCIVSVEGCVIHGVQVVNHEQLFKMAPADIVNSISREILSLATPSEAEIKN